jgi:hypothetical protein
MNTPMALRVQHPRHFLFRLGAIFVALISTLASVLAQTGTGSISGTVANAATHLFLTQAEVRIAGTNQSTLTDRDGSFTLRDVPAGSV